MAKDADKLIRIFEALTSYLPVQIRHYPTLTRLPPSWANEIGVAQPVPELTGPPPPWPIGVTFTPAMLRVRDWLIQHRDQCDTDGYRANYDWLAEQMGLSPDTLEPLRSSPRAPRPATSPPTEQATKPAIEPASEPVPLAESDAFEAAPKPESAERAERPATLAETEASDTAPCTAEAAPAAVEVANTASVTDRKKRKPGAGNKPKLTDEEIGQLQDALNRKIDDDSKQGRYKNAREFLQHHVMPKIMKAREVAEVAKTTVGNSLLDRRVIKPVLDARRERSLAVSK